MNIKDNIISNILNMLKDENIDHDKPLKILNVFYDTKIDTDTLKDNFKNLEIIDYKIENQNIDNLNLNTINLNKSFDYIILFETIEKLINYIMFLVNIKKYLKDDGNIVCIIPNIMYKDILNNILKGKFTYCNDGIINKSNLRFFTLDEMINLLDIGKYNVNKIMAIVTSTTPQDEELINSLCNISNEGFRLNFNTHSYIISGSQKKDKTLYDYILSE